MLFKSIPPLGLLGDALALPGRPGWRKARPARSVVNEADDGHEPRPW
jgi:hypothetical protein